MKNSLLNLNKLALMAILLIGSSAFARDRHHHHHDHDSDHDMALWAESLSTTLEITTHSDDDYNLELLKIVADEIAVFQITNEKTYLLAEILEAYQSKDQQLNDQQKAQLLLHKVESLLLKQTKD